MSKTPPRSPYASRTEPAPGVGAPIRQRQTSYLPNGREPVGLSERAIGFLIGAAVVGCLGMFVLAILLTAGGQ